MKLKTESVSLTDDLNIVVCEADAGYDARVRLAISDAESSEGDPLFVFFKKTFYPLLYSVTRDCPSAEDAFALDPAKLDEWYKAVWKLNESLLGKYTEPKTKEVVFRDNSKITLIESQDYPSYLIRLVKYEDEADNKKDVPAEEVSFRSYVYPKIAACVVGDPPPVDDVIKNFPHSEIAKWSAVAMDLNKNWFDLIYQEAEKIKAQESEKKKRGRRSHNKKTRASSKNSR